jgi:hypothetical protein
MPLPLVAGALLAPALLYGAWARHAADTAGGSPGLALVLTVTFVHFWYDGFTWSVRPATTRPHAPTNPAHAAEVSP